MNALLLCLWFVASESLPFLLDFSHFGQHFDGIGAVSGGGGGTRLLIDYTPVTRARIFDALFSPNAGAALQMIKVEVGSDAQTTQGTEQSHARVRGDLNCTRGWEWDVLVEARARNPAIKTYGLSWAVPSWIGDGSFFSDDNIKYHIDWLFCARTFHNVTIDLLGIWNENACDANWVKSLRGALDAAGFETTRIVAADGDWSVADAMTRDPTFAAAVDVLGVHYPTMPPTAAVSLDKTIYASEMWNLSATNDWQGAADLAVDLSQHARWGLSSSFVWCLVFSWYANLAYGHETATSNSGSGHALLTASEPWSGYYELNPPLAIVAHWTQFTKVGWTYLQLGTGLGTLPLGGTFNTLVNTHTSAQDLEFSIILESMRASGDEEVTFSIKGLTEGRAMPAFVYVWITTATTPLVRIADALITPNGTFTLTVLANTMMSVTTTRGQGWVENAKGWASGSPASAPFPFPFSETFDGVKEGAYAPYFSDMAGVWVSAPLPTALATSKSKLFHTHGVIDSAITQVIPADPGTHGWAKDPFPFTIVGNPNGGGSSEQVSWIDYTLRARGALDSKVIPTPSTVLNVTLQAACDASKVSQIWIPIGGDLVTTPARLSNGGDALTLCLALLGPDPDRLSSLRVGLKNCSVADTWTLSATGQIATAGMCLDVWAHNTSIGGRVIAVPCQWPVGTNEEWVSSPSASGAFSFSTLLDGLCLDITSITTPLMLPFLWIAMRINNFGSNGIPDGYALYVTTGVNASALGSWTFMYKSTTLQSGETLTPIIAGVWYNFELVAEGTTITASLDGTTLARIVSNASHFGNVAVGSGWHGAWWDDIQVVNSTLSVSSQ